jgi:hypothetical protein
MPERTSTKEALMPLTRDLFEKRIQELENELPGSRARLDIVCNALDSFFTDGADVDCIDDCIDSLCTHLNVAVRKWEDIGELHGKFLDWLIKELKNLRTYKSPREKRNVTQDQLLRNCERRFISMTQYACSDWKQFKGNVHPALQLNDYEDLRRRFAAVPNERAQMEARANGIAIPFRLADRSTQLGQMKQVAHLIREAKSACCTTFALAAAHVLLKPKENPDNAVRVEIVTTGNHYFVIVGRSGGVTDDVVKTLAPPHTWGSTAVIIDPWLGSLGHNYDLTVTDHPYPNFLNCMQVLDNQC